MKAILIVSLITAGLMTACCPDYEGYGRYTLKVDCQTVTIEEVSYQLTYSTSTDNYVINGQTISRGVMRKVRPWLYIHQINDTRNTVDVTFDIGEKPEYPLYTGSSGSIFDVFSKPWEIEKSTCLLFEDKHWLVAHRWDTNGVYFDLLHNLGSVEAWSFLDEIFVPNDGDSHVISAVHVKIVIVEFNSAAKTATVKLAPV